MKRIFYFKLIFILFTVLVYHPPIVSANDEIYEYGTGFIWEPWGVVEDHLLEIPPTEDVLPTAVDLTDTFPVPGNQGSQNSCTAWAVAYALKSHQEQTKRNWGFDSNEHLFSPSYVYNQVNGGIDNGTTPSSVMNIIQKQGVCSLASFPYSTSDYTTQPTAEQIAEAGHFKISSYFTVSGIESIKSRLADGDGVVVGFEVFPDFRQLNPSNPIYDVADGTSSGSHSVCFIGYDDAKGAFKFINSWGTDWGLDGYGWISYDILGKTGLNFYGEPVGFVMEPRSYIFSESFFDYSISNGKASIRGYFGLDTEVTIPDTFGGYPVAEISYNAFKGCSSVTSFMLPDSVTYIGPEAFADCLSLSSIVIPDSVTYINDNAFYYIDDNGQKNPLPNLTLYCSENSYAHQYAIDNKIPFELINLNQKRIEVTALANNENIIIDNLIITNAKDDLYDISIKSKNNGDVYFILATYNGNKMTKAFISENGRDIKNLPETDLQNCKIFVWTKYMQPCIEAVNGDIAF